MQRNFRQIGMKKKVAGEEFELAVQLMANREDWNILKIPSGCRFLSRVKIIPVKSPFDFILAKPNRIIFFDAKSIGDGTFGFSKINQNQLSKLSLLDCVAPAGYVVNFTKHNQVVFFAVKDLREVRFRSSLKPMDGVLLGTSRDFRFDRVFNMPIDAA